MQINKNTIVVFNLNDANSQELANHYVLKHNLDSSQKVGINCSSNRILNNYSDFFYQVELQIKTAIDSLSFDVFCIFLSINTPFGFLDNLQTVTSSSRLSLINYGYQKKFKNVLFNRKDIKSFTEVNLEQGPIICSHISLTDLQQSKKVINKSVEINNQYFIYGKLFKNTNYFTNEFLGYQDNLKQFQRITQVQTGLEVVEITNNDQEFSDIPFLREDSFFFGYIRKSNELSDGLFVNSSSARVFFYDMYSNFLADESLKNGYVSSIYNFSEASDDSLIYPVPMFNGFINGMTTGQAYLYSVKYLNWSQGLIGDPLTFVNLRYKDQTFTPVSPFDPNSSKNQVQVWSKIANSIAKSLAYYYNQTEKYNKIFNECLFSEQTFYQVDCLKKYHNIQKNIQSVVNKAVKFQTLVRNLIGYGLQIYSQQLSANGEIRIVNIQNFLTDNELQISQILQKFDSRFSFLNRDLYYVQGNYQIVIDVTKYDEQTQNYDFQVEISLDKEFTQIIKSYDTVFDFMDFKYQRYVNQFIDFPYGGIEFFYYGRKVVIKILDDTDVLLNRYQIYYYRIRQKTINGVYPWISNINVIWT